MVLLGKELKLEFKSTKGYRHEMESSILLSILSLYIQRLDTGLRLAIAEMSVQKERNQEEF